MIRKYILIPAIVLFLGMTNALAEQHLTRDEILTTLDRTCGIHYITRGNTIGWYITEVEGSCPNQLLNGAGTVTLRNAFGRIVGQLDGFFTQGYWTGAQSITQSLKTLFLSDDNEQALSFDWGKEDMTDVSYIGKMVSVPFNNQEFSPFQACRPARILAVTPTPDLFEDETTQQALIQSVIGRVQSICPGVEQIYFYGSEKDHPSNEDIFFFADINLADKQIKVRRLPSSPRNRDILNNDETTSAKPRPHEIRQEKGEPIIQIQPIITPSIGETPTYKEQPIPTDLLSQTLPDTISSSEAEPPLITSSPSPDSDLLDKVPHLLTVSRLLKQPVTGRALVHINRFDGPGAVIIDEPVMLRARGSNLSLGWGIAQGEFSAAIMGGIPSTQGFIDIDSFSPVKEAD